MSIKTLLMAASAAVALTAAPATAQAQSWFVSPFAATHMGGDTTDTTNAVGVSGGWLGDGWFGVEGDAGWAPTFFEQNGFLVERRVTTVMGNVMFVPRLPGTIQPVLSGGAGLISPRLAEAGELFAAEADQFGWNIGGGALLMGDRVGGRIDLRYFRTAGDDSDGAGAFGLDFSRFSFWRASAGLLVRF